MNEETILTITFNDWSVQSFNHITEWHIDNKTLWFVRQPNAIKSDKTYCVPIQSMKMYEIEKVSKPGVPLEDSPLPK